MTLKSLKMDIWTWCLLGVLVDPWNTKMVTQGTPNGPSESPEITVFTIKRDPVQKSTSQQAELPAAKGAGGRGEALTNA